MLNFLLEQTENLISVYQFVLCSLMHLVCQCISTKEKFEHSAVIYFVIKNVLTAMEIHTTIQDRIMCWNNVYSRDGFSRIFITLVTKSIFK